MKRNSMFILSAFILFSAFSCGTNGSKTTSTDITEKKVIVQVPQFDADSAYKYIQAQVDFAHQILKVMLPVETTWPPNWPNMEPK